MCYVCDAVSIITIDVEAALKDAKVGNFARELTGEKDLNFSEIIESEEYMKMMKDNGVDDAMQPKASDTATASKMILGMMIPDGNPKKCFGPIVLAKAMQITMASLLIMSKKFKDDRTKEELVKSMLATLSIYRLLAGDELIKELNRRIDVEKNRQQNNEGPKEGPLYGHA